MRVKELIHPVTGRRVKLGRNRPVSRHKLALATYLPKLPGTPVNIDYSPKAKASLDQIYLNDTFGDCVPAAASHLDGVLTGNASGSPVIFTDQQIEAQYTGMSGGVFNPNDSNTDQGCDLPTALAFWKSNGLLSDGSHKIVGWLSVNPADEVEIRAAVFFFENLYFGLELPDPWVNPFPSISGFTWDVAGDPDPSNGHCITGVSCDIKGVQVATWAMIGTMTYAAIAKYCDAGVGGELYCVLSQDIINKAMQKAPVGLKWDQLMADF